MDSPGHRSRTCCGHTNRKMISLQLTVPTRATRFVGFSALGPFNTSKLSGSGHRCDGKTTGALDQGDSLFEAAYGQFSVVFRTVVGLWRRHASDRWSGATWRGADSGLPLWRLPLPGPARPPGKDRRRSPRDASLSVGEMQECQRRSKTSSTGRQGCGCHRGPSGVGKTLAGVGRQIRKRKKGGR